MATALRPPAVRRREPSLAALALVTGVGPFATDTYLAALPQVRAALATSPAAAQLTVTSFIVGLAVGQLLAGPFSDSTGRRGPVLWGAALFAGLSLVCALAPSAALLVAARLAQGLAAGAAVAVGRAVVADRYEGADAARRYGTLAGITLLAPVVAPAVGGALLAVGTWRTVFAFLTALGVVMVAAAALGVPESLPPERRQAAGLRALGARTADLLGDRAFRSPVAVQCLATAGFFVYIGGSAFVLQTQLRIGPGLYSAVFATDAAAMVTASWLFRALVVRRGPVALRRVGLATSTTATALLVVLAAAAGGRLALWPVWVLLAAAVAGMGLVMPATTVLAQEAGRRSGGTASSLSGGLAFLVGAATTPATGLLGSQTVLLMASGMTALLACALLVAEVGGRRRRRPARA